MSDHRAADCTGRQHRTRALAALMACMSVLGGSLGAQSAAELTQRVAAMQDSVRATQARLATARTRHTLALDDSIVVDGMTVRFPSRALSDRDRAAIRAGLADGHRSLTADFGEAATRLVAGDRWSIALWSQNVGRDQTAALTGDPAIPGSRRKMVPFPLEAKEVALFVRDRAGERLAARDPVIDAFIGADLSLAPQERTLYLALRNLVSSRSSVARRCADGAMAACRTMLDARAADEWFAPADSATRDGRPFPRWVHGTLVQVALEIGGERALASLSAPVPAEDAVSRLAAAAGTTPDSLLMAWSARMHEGTERNAAPSMPLATSAAFWCGVFLLAATRRRPR